MTSRSYLIILLYQIYILLVMHWLWNIYHHNICLIIMILIYMKSENEFNYLYLYTFQTFLNLFLGVMSKIKKNENKSIELFQKHIANQDTKQISSYTPITNLFLFKFVIRLLFLVFTENTLVYGLNNICKIALTNGFKVQHVHKFILVNKI